MINIVSLSSIIILLFFIPLAWSKQVNANYYTTKTFLFYFTTSLSFIWLFIRSKEIKFPKLNKTIWIPLFFILCFNLFYPLMMPHWGYALFSFKFYCVLFLTLFLYNLDFDPQMLWKKLYIPFILMVIGVLFFTFYDIYRFRIVQDNLEPWMVLGSFGNVNMLAEFFIMFLPLIYYWTLQQDQFPKFLKLAVFCIWFFVVLYARSRSSWIGLGLWFAIMLWFRISKQHIIALAISLGLFFLITMTPATNNNVVQAKSNSFAERISLYQSSFDLISEAPLGVGIGTFINKIIPYRVIQDFKPYEYEYADQPHSEWLKWTLQYGWLGIILIAVMLFGILTKVLPSKNLHFYGAIAVLIPQLTFQFPFENPATNLVLCLYFAWGLKEFFTPHQLKISNPMKSFFVFIGLIGVLNSGLFISSVYIESQYPKDIDKTSIICDLYPINVRPCNMRNNQLIQTNTTAARLAMFEKLPFYYFTSDFQRSLPIYLQAIKNEMAMCNSLQIYQMIYAAQKSFETKTLEFCNSKYPKPFTFITPKQFLIDYYNWTEKTLSN